MSPVFPGGTTAVVVFLGLAENLIMASKAAWCRWCADARRGVRWFRIMGFSRVHSPHHLATMVTTQSCTEPICKKSILFDSNDLRAKPLDYGAVLQRVVWVVFRMWQTTRSLDMILSSRRWRVACPFLLRYSVFRAMLEMGNHSTSSMTKKSKRNVAQASSR